MMKDLVDQLIGTTNAIVILKEDHRKVEQLFNDFNNEENARTKFGIARLICHELDVHATVEERLFYPQSKSKAKDATKQINEGIVEHEGIKRLVKQLSKMKFTDAFFQSRMKVLEEYVKHHVREEEYDMFPRISDSGIDLESLGKKLLALKTKLRQTKATSASHSKLRRRPTANGAARSNSLRH